MRLNRGGCLRREIVQQARLGGTVRAGAGLEGGASRGLGEQASSELPLQEPLPFPQLLPSARGPQDTPSAVTSSGGRRKHVSLGGPQSARPRV